MDGSVVTQMDKDIERAIAEFPDDTVIGEEGDGYNGTSEYSFGIVHNPIMKQTLLLLWMMACMNESVYIR